MTNTQTQRITLDPGSGERADGQHFTCPDARNRFFAVGHAPQGGRHEMNGPVYSEPFAFVYGCAAVLTDGPENPMAKYAETIVRAGDVVEIKGYGLHRVDRDLDGYNLKLTKVADEDETPEPELDLARVTRQIERLRELGQTDSDEYPRLIGRAARLRHLVAVMRRDARDSERIAASDPFAEPEARYSVHDVSLGAAGLTARPAVYDRELDRTVKVYRQTEREAAERHAAQLNAADRAEAERVDDSAELERLAASDDPRVTSWANGWSPLVAGEIPVDDAGVPISFSTYDEAVAWKRRPAVSWESAKRIGHNAREARSQIRETLGWGSYLAAHEVEALRRAETILDAIAEDSDESCKAADEREGNVR